MKKSLWIFGVAVIALTGCTNNEVVDIPWVGLCDFVAFYFVVSISPGRLVRFVRSCLRSAVGKSSSPDNPAEKVQPAELFSTSSAFRHA